MILKGLNKVEKALVKAFENAAERGDQAAMDSTFEKIITLATEQRLERERKDKAAAAKRPRIDTYF